MTQPTPEIPDQHTPFGVYHTVGTVRLDLSYMRKVIWTPNPTPDSADMRESVVFVFITGSTDISPIYKGAYDGRCDCCYLGFGHSIDEHNQSVALHADRNP